MIRPVGKKVVRDSKHGHRRPPRSSKTSGWVATRAANASGAVAAEGRSGCRSTTKGQAGERVREQARRRRARPKQRPAGVERSRDTGLQGRRSWDEAPTKASGRTSEREGVNSAAPGVRPVGRRGPSGVGRFQPVAAAIAPARQKKKARWNWRQPRVAPGLCACQTTPRRVGRV
ncbi:hypothetical protein BDY21DRAFT_339129 [Lineolata rhizophorae]|uniref:Uncharacterized protein n=1 Tax=Lineolata rhizophorae TaxID=578093 RepID=A0A6A6P4R4_9PEZI|nr:hypothetical protein BDY21DRAFT_339129 [Lineolata rhizophorae]